MSTIFRRICAALAVLLFTIFPGYGQDVLINEIMSANDSTLQDLDGDYSDWIELYNSDSVTLDLTDYSISDNENELRKWIFPPVRIAPKDYLLLFASGKDRKDMAELHTNFRISAEGEAIFLSDQRGSLVDGLDPYELMDDIALARIPDGSKLWIRSSRPTPGRSNESDNQLSFSHRQGFYEDPIKLLIASLFDDSVYYSLDGSIPTETSHMYRDGLYLGYTDSIANYFSEIVTSAVQSEISYKAWLAPGINVDKVNTIRCASYKEGVRTSPIYTRTFVIKPDVFSDYSMPVVSIVTEEDSLFGYEKGILVPGINQEVDNPGKTGNFFQRGMEWEREIHIEFFEPDGTLGFSQEAGIRVHGGLTRQCGQKTLRVIARKEYGKGTFDHQLLPQKEIDSYKRFLLRTTFGGSTLDDATIRDVLAHELVRDLDFEIQDFQPVIVYINGEYWGIHTLRDRIDEHYIEYIAGANSDSVDIVNGKASKVEVGSNRHFMELAEFIDQHDLAKWENYAHVCSAIDIQSFTDYIIAEMFLANWDWPGNNQKLWRPQTPAGKWRWIFFDLDIAYYDLPTMFERVMLNEGERPWYWEVASSLLLRNLLKNSEYKTFFLKRFAEILDSVFTPEKIYTKAHAIMDLYRPEISRHSQRWHFPESMQTWELDINNIVHGFLLERRCEVARQVINYFDLEDFGFTCSSPKDFEDWFVVAPNPSDGNFCILNNSSFGVLGELFIFDVTGRIVFIQKDLFLGDHEKSCFNLPGLGDGIYYIKLLSDEKTAVKSFVIK